MDMRADTTFTSGGKSIPAELSRPAGASNGGVIVIAYGSDGFVDNEHGAWATMIRQYASDLAGEGFHVLVPDYFARTDTQAGDVDFQNGGAGQIWLHRDDWQFALGDAVDHARALPGVDPARTGLLGFSLGGHLCLRLRAKARVLVEFFAPLLDGVGAAGSPDLRAQIHGRADTLVPLSDNATRIEQQLRAAGALTECWDYDGATHGFPGADAANSKARALSRTRTIAFFREHL